MLPDGSDPAGNTATATITGLVPGVTYDTRLYVCQWGARNRQATVAFDTHGDGDWQTAETIGLLLPTDQQFCLHMVATNYDPPGWGAVVARLELPENYVFLETGTNVLETDELLWLVNNTGFGDPMVAPVSLGAYRVAPWGQNANPGFPSSAQWLWLGQSVPDKALCFSVPLPVKMVPEPASCLLLAAGLLGLLRREVRTPRP